MSKTDGAGSRRWAPLGAGSFAVMALAQIAVPLTDDDRVLTVVVIVAFALTTFALTARRWGPGRAGAAIGLVGTGTLLLERIGTSTGFPFGAYEYTGALRPEIGGVPAIVPLAWFAMGIPALVVGRCLAGPARNAAGRVRASVAAAVALTAWDLFLDPQMVEEGYWTWAVDGAYRGIPLSNYAGWLGSSFVVALVVDRVLPEGAAPIPSGPTPGSQTPGSPTPFTALYAWWAVMSTVGFVVFFGDPVVGLVGGAVMVPLAVVGLLRSVRRPGPDERATPSAQDLRA